MDEKSYEKRIKFLEDRLSILEKKIEAAEYIEKVSVNKTNEHNPLFSKKLTSWQNLSPLAQTTVQAKDLNFINENTPSSSTHSGNWLGIIAIICFIFATAFIFKLSVETGWLTPERQIVLFALLGIVFITTGFFLINNYPIYARILPAAGIIIVYLSIFASHRFYGLISFKLALLMVNFVSALCVWFFWKFRHDIYAIIVVIGTYLAPIILNLHFASFFTIHYFLSCSLTFAILSIWTRSRILIVLSAYLAILCTFIIGLELNQNAMIAIALALNFIIFAAGTYYYSICNNQKLTEYESWTLFPVMILIYSLEYFLVNSIQPNLAPWVSLLFAIFLIGLYRLATRWFPNQKINSQGIIFAFTSIVLFHSFYIELLPPTIKPWLFVALMLALALLPERFLKQRKDAVFYTPIMIFFLILIIEYCNIIYGLLYNYSQSSLIVATAAFICIWLVLCIHQKYIYKSEEYGIAFLGSAHLLGLIALYHWTYVYGSLAVTGGWLIYALIIMGIAYHYRDRFIAYSSLILLTLSIGKTLLYDASITPTAIRILFVFITGFVLYGAGYLMKKVSKWNLS